MEGKITTKTLDTLSLSQLIPYIQADINFVRALIQNFGEFAYDRDPNILSHLLVLLKNDPKFIDQIRSSIYRALERLPDETKIQNIPMLLQNSTINDDTLVSIKDNIQESFQMWAQTHKPEMKLIIQREIAKVRTLYGTERYPNEFEHKDRTLPPYLRNLADIQDRDLEY